MDFRKTFDKIPESFDKYRPRYCKELFQELKVVCGLDSKKKVLEIGPGTGQATEPILKTGCDYTAIELGENFSSFMKNKFGCYQNFHIVNANQGLKRGRKTAQESRECKYVANKSHKALLRCMRQ